MTTREGLVAALRRLVGEPRPGRGPGAARRPRGRRARAAARLARGDARRGGDRRRRSRAWTGDAARSGAAARGRRSRWRSLPRNADVAAIRRADRATWPRSAAAGSSRGGGIAAWSMTRAPLCPGCGLPFRPLRTDRTSTTATAAETAAYRLAGCTFDELLALDVACRRARRRRRGSSPRVPRARRRPGRSPARGARRRGPRLHPARPAVADALARRGAAARGSHCSSPTRSRTCSTSSTSRRSGSTRARWAGSSPRSRSSAGRSSWSSTTAGRSPRRTTSSSWDPGAGEGGGRVVFEGAAGGAVGAPTPRRGGGSRGGSAASRGPARGRRSAATDWVRIEDAAANNLRDIDVEIPIGRLTVVAGPSGAGKTTLVRDVLLASLTDGEPRGCRGARRARTCGPSPSPRSRSGATRVRTPPPTRASRTRSDRCSPPRPARRRRASRSTGPRARATRARASARSSSKLPYVPSEWIACEACGGRRFRAETLAVEVALADGVRTVGRRRLRPVGRRGGGRSSATAPRGRILASLQAVGLGYLRARPGRRRRSRAARRSGSSSRKQLATARGRRPRRPRRADDRPPPGRRRDPHRRAARARRARARPSSSSSTSPTSIAAADWLVRLGPGGGPDGGRLAYAGLPATTAARAAGPAPDRRRVGGRGRAPRSGSIGASANNLRDVSVRIAKGAITARGRRVGLRQVVARPRRPRGGGAAAASSSRSRCTSGSPIREGPEAPARPHRGPRADDLDPRRRPRPGGR